MDCSPPGSSIHGIFWARVLGWVAISFSIFLFIYPVNVRGSNFFFFFYFLYVQFIKSVTFSLNNSKVLGDYSLWINAMIDSSVTREGRRTLGNCYKAPALGVNQNKVI